MTIYIVDYLELNVDGIHTGLTLTEEIEGKARAERRARFVSDTMFTGGFDGNTVHVYKKHNPTGERVFFGGVISHEDASYA